MIGFINLNKPSGWTSHDCVAKIRRLLKTRKVGHGGTLDPAATGVLPIAVGKATRLLSFLPEKKVYHARIRLGVLTTTDDLEGEILKTCPCSQISLDRIQIALKQFIGVIEQVPPIYSAIKKDGKKLYELARKGEKIDASSRRVEVRAIDLLNWYPGEFPEVEVAITCGAGTYIRSLARDLGNSLKVGGTLAQLIRTESCGMKSIDSLTIEFLTNDCQQGNVSLIPVAIALQHLPVISLGELESKHWCQGKKILVNIEDIQYSVARINSDREIQKFIRIQDRQATFLGIGELITEVENQWLSHKVVFGE